MTEHVRSVSGEAKAATGGVGGAEGTANARDNSKEATYWVSHRMGPFLIHDNTKDCEPQPNDNVGYLDNKDSAIDQGFMPCPKCLS